MKKVELNSISHAVRAAQAVLQYGVGAMVDFPDQTLMTAAPEFWENTVTINDDRFASALNVKTFKMPTKIAYTRFPEWYFCPKCRKFQPLKDWINEHRRKSNVKELEHNADMVNNLQCKTCRQDLVVSRIITACENGHISDFPWINWVHRMAGKQVCNHPDLRFKTSVSGTEGLEGLVIECVTCKATTTLAKAFDPTIFEKLDQESNNKDFGCKGYHPFNNTHESCGCYPRTLQRGGSSVYFPLIVSSLVIPPLKDTLLSQLKLDETFLRVTTEYGPEDLEQALTFVEGKVKNASEEIANRIGGSKEDIQKITLEYIQGQDNDSIEVGSVDYKYQEYQALKGEIENSNNAFGDFVRVSRDTTEYQIPFIKNISLINKVRVINALIGFSRINPIQSEKDKGFVSIKKPDTLWYPGYEVRGEGIFIEFDEEAISKWLNQSTEIQERIDVIDQNYSMSYIGERHPRNITAKFVLLHTISHLLISQLSFECGYSVASLSERLYCSDNDGQSMAGIFIYTSSGDSEGTLGGLVRQGESDTFPTIFRKAIANAKICSNDPVCIMSRGQGRDSLNLAACHSCALLPETSCEERNAFLDRALIVGTFDNPDLGFWNELSQ